MRKILLTLAIAASSFFASAADVTVNQETLNAFKAEFIGARDAKWSETEGVYKVDFKYSDFAMAAYYTKEGELMAVTRNVGLQEVPATLQNKLKADYADFWITGLYEISADDDTEFLITMENADHKVVLKSSGKKWNVVKKTTKA